MAALVMIRYRDLLQQKDHFIDPSFKNISQIKMTNTQLEQSPLSSEQQFIATVSLAYAQNSKHKIESRKEIFTFDGPHSNLVLLGVQSDVESQAPLEGDIEKKYNDEYFQHRVVAYTWLAYLDGSKSHKKQLDNTHYNVVIGDKKWSGLAPSIIKKRHSLLAKGGHILHSLHVKPFKLSDTYRTIDLIIEWKGENLDGTAVFAKIKQTIQYQRFKNGAWLILDVSEKHLLPTNMPWQGLLC